MDKEGPTWELVVQIQALGESEQVKRLAWVLLGVCDWVSRFSLVHLGPAHTSLATCLTLLWLDCR